MIIIYGPKVLYNGFCTLTIWGLINSIFSSPMHVKNSVILIGCRRHGLCTFCGRQVLVFLGQVLYEKIDIALLKE
jgi:hypothetical protein